MFVGLCSPHEFYYGYIPPNPRIHQVMSQLSYRLGWPILKQYPTDNLHECKLMCFGVYLEICAAPRLIIVQLDVDLLKPRSWEFKPRSQMLAMDYFSSLYF
jgi:hypothetical protein